MRALKTRLGLLVLSLTLPAALLGAAAMMKRALIRIRTTDDTISVPGAAKRRVQTDQAIWRLTLSAPAKETAEGYRVMASDLATVTGYLLKRGFAPRELQPAPARYEEVRTRDEGGNFNVTGYTILQTLEVQSSDLARVKATAVAASSDLAATPLAAHGTRVESRPPDYRHSRLPELKYEVLEEATRNARRRAQQMAEAAGAKLGRLLSASLGDIQIRSPTSTNPYADDEPSQEKDITANVSLTYAVE